MRRFVNDAPRAATLDAAIGPVDGPDDLCLVIGGDGTMLRAIQQFGPEYVYLGVNGGHLGFLMNDVPEDTAAAAAVARALLLDWVAHPFPRLHVRVEPGGREAWALNDIYVEREAQTCHLRMTVDGVEIVGKKIGRAHV